MNNEYYNLFCVRDSENSIDKVLKSLLEQTIPPKEIIVVNDGSSDKTGDILQLYQKEFPNIITIFQTNNKTRDYSRIPTLWNMCLKKDYEFHMVGAGDVSYEKNYAEKLLEEFKLNPNLVICSGDFDQQAGITPQGAGRMVRQSFFYKFYEKYPEIMGYESELLHRAILNGYEIKVVNANMHHHEKLGHGYNFSEFGQGMRALGYHPFHVLLRFILEFTKNKNLGRKGALLMLWYYLTYKPQKQGYYSLFPTEVRKNIRDSQIKALKLGLKHKLLLER